MVLVKKIYSFTKIRPWYVAHSDSSNTSLTCHCLLSINKQKSIATSL